MTNNNSEDRLDRIEGLLEVTVQGLAETRKLTESNSRAIESNTRNIAETRAAIAETRSAISEIKTITESNGKAIQAMLDDKVTERGKHEQQLEEQRELNRKMTRYIDGLGKMMLSIDEDRPTILRKLTMIENKLDSLQIIETKLDRIIEEK